jgi:hypothetical protein
MKKIDLTKWKMEAAVIDFIAENVAKEANNKLVEVSEGIRWTPWFWGRWRFNGNKPISSALLNLNASKNRV